MIHCLDLAATNVRQDLFNPFFVVVRSTVGFVCCELIICNQIYSKGSRRRRMIGNWRYSFVRR